MDNATIVAARGRIKRVIGSQETKKNRGKKIHSNTRSRHTRIDPAQCGNPSRKFAIFFPPLPPFLRTRPTTILAAAFDSSRRFPASLRCCTFFPSPPPIFPCLNKPLDKRNWLKRKILDLEPSQSYYYSQSEWHKIALLFVLNVLSRDTVSRARRRYELFQNREFSWINRMVERVQKSSLVCATLSNLLSLFEKEKEI